MLKVKTYNAISDKGLTRFNSDLISVSADHTSPDALMLRSYKLQADEIDDTVLCVGRAGAGVNNIPLPTCTDRGIPVFNAPGANANAVKELVLCGLLLSSRGIIDGINFAKGLEGETDNSVLNKTLEAEKKRFKGRELQGKTLGVVGLGAIGSLVAQTGLMMGMNVVGYDPALSVEAAWRLPSDVKKMDNLSALFAKSDYVTLHLPVLDSTRGLVSHKLVEGFKPGLVLLNFARAEIVDPEAVVAGMESGRIAQYICDFPHPSLAGVTGITAMPHIGASTDEAEENCAIMVADQLQDFLLNGNIKNSVNFPALSLERTEGYRITVTNSNIPKMLGAITSAIADANLNVLDMLNKSRENIAYNIIDVADEPTAEVLQVLQDLEGVINVRVI